MKKLFLSILLLPLLGCFSTPNSNFFVLEPIDIPTVSSKKTTITVYDVNIPDFIDRPQIVLQKPNSPKITISEFNRWATDLNVMIKNTLIADLKSALPNAKIIPLNFGSNYQYVIKINIEELNGWFNDTAHLKINWQILKQSGKVLYSQNLQYTALAGKNYESYVQAQSKLLSNLSQDIAQKLSKM